MDHCDGASALMTQPSATIREIDNDDNEFADALQTTIIKRWQFIYCTVAEIAAE
ncbi:MAG: hypothetical protein ACI915_002564 [Gammaproteobacteria bacterium]|jgi:hypothetical protein